MKKLFQAALVALTTTLGFVLPLTAKAQQTDREAICKLLSDDLVAELSSEPHSKDYRLFRVEAFHSAKLDTCIHVEAKLFGPDVMVRDMTYTVIKAAHRFFPPLLLHCDSEGIDEADIDVVRSRGGRVEDLPYEEWLTDGQGGLPRALKAPDTPLSRTDCEKALESWLVRWR